MFASGWGQEDFDLAQGGAVRHANGLYTSGSYFGTLGVRPAMGRLFNAADDQRGCPSVAVLSYGFWQDHFGGEQGAVQRSLAEPSPVSSLAPALRGFTASRSGTSLMWRFPSALLPS